MKELKRLSLDELAKVMPVIEEEEQKQYVGGTHFYDYQGNMLGEIGNEGDIRIISENNYNDLKNKNDYNNYSSWGVPIQQAKLESESVKNILSSVTGYSPNTFLITSGISNDEAKTLYINPTTYLIEIDMTSLTIKDVNCMLSTMSHESYHIAHSNDKDAYGNPLSDWEHEKNAYLNQTSDSNFKSLPLEYRQKIAGFWEAQAATQYSGALPNSVSISIRSRCGLL